MPPWSACRNSISRALSPPFDPRKTPQWPAVCAYSESELRACEKPAVLLASWPDGTPFVFCTSASARPSTRRSRPGAAARGLFWRFAFRRAREFLFLAPLRSSSSRGLMISSGVEAKQRVAAASGAWKTTPNEPAERRSRFPRWGLSPCFLGVTRRGSSVVLWARVIFSRSRAIRRPGWHRSFVYENRSTVRFIDNGHQMLIGTYSKSILRQF